MENTINPPVDYQLLYENLVINLQTVNALYVELHKTVMDTNPEIILNNSIKLI